MKLGQFCLDQQEDPLFVCDVCKEPVILYNGKNFKTCEHLNSDVVITNRGLEVASRGFQVAS